MSLAEILESNGGWVDHPKDGGAALNARTPEGQLVLGIFAALAEFERALISERIFASLVATFKGEPPQPSFGCIACNDLKLT